MNYSNIVMSMFVVALVAFAWLVPSTSSVAVSSSGHHVIDQEDLVNQSREVQQEKWIHPRLRGLELWQRPSGPPHVAIQVGHLEAASAPEELRALRRNTGAQFGDVTEVSVNQNIARQTKELLEARGVKVTLLPVTIPPNFYADVFLAVHADGSENVAANGYKIAAPRRDASGNAPVLVDFLEKSYGQQTGLVRDPKVTWNMIGYYAFNWRRYDHSMHPLSAAAIVETGFLTNAGDRKVIVEQPEKSALGIVGGVVAYLEAEDLL